MGTVATLLKLKAFKGAVLFCLCVLRALACVSLCVGYAFTNELTFLLFLFMC